MAYYCPTNSPLLHLTVGFTAVVDEAGLVAHPVAVDHHAAVQVQTVLATVGEVLLHHATSTGHTEGGERGTLEDMDMRIQSRV